MSKNCRLWVFILGLAVITVGDAMAQRGPVVKITGTVRDPNGAGVEGVMVSITPAVGARQEVETDHSGRYEISRPVVDFRRNQKGYLVARSEARNLVALHELDENATNLDLSLNPGMTLVATVQDASGKPLAGASGSVFTFDGRATMNGLAAKPTMSDARGRMEFSAIPQAKSYGLNVSAPGFGTVIRTIPPPTDQSNRLEFPPIVLPAADLTVAGWVLDADGNPLAGARVMILGQTQVSGNGNTDEQGHFFFTGVCAGAVQLTANPPPPRIRPLNQLPGAVRPIPRGAPTNRFKPEGEAANFIRTQMPMLLPHNEQTIGGDTNVVIVLRSSMPHLIPRQAAPAMRAMSDGDSLEAIVSTNRGERLAAAIELEQKRREVVEQLLVILDSSQPEKLKMDAVMVLGQYRAEEAVPILVRHLEWDDAYLQEEKEQGTGPILAEEGGESGGPVNIALWRIGAPAIPALLERISTTDDASAAGRCVRICQRIEGAEATRARLQGMLKTASDAKIKGRIQAALDALK